MNLRTRLLLYFLSISTLIISTGMIFYFQLNNLIGPLTPQSIPQNIDNLEKYIGQRNIMNDFLYRQLLVNRNLEGYVLTKNVSFLQKYYMNESLLRQAADKFQGESPGLWSGIKNLYDSLTDSQNDILKKSLQGDFVDAKAEIESQTYSAKSRAVWKQIDIFDSNVNLYEKYIVSLKTTVENTKIILRHSLNTTLIILINALIFLFLLTYFSAKKILEPINLLRNEIEDMISTNQMNLPSPDLVALKGEVGDLARSFSTLINKLKTTTVQKDELLAEVKRRKEFEEKLQKTAENLKETNMELDQFAYAASHDLRGPLHAIENLSTWIEEACYNQLPPQSRRHFDLLKRRVRILNALISGMLEYARAGKPGVIQESVDVSQLITDIIENLSPPASIEIFIDNKLPVLTTNKIALNQVFLNLINNAIKYNDKAMGEIHIGSQSFSDHIQFYVKDNGPGIKSEFHQKIFEIFQTLQSRDSVESAGIGLALVKKVIEKVKGSIWLTSTVGKGTEFYFNWPTEIK